MNPESLDERHLSAEGFAAYVRAGVPILHPVPGTPPIMLFFDPEGHRVGLRGPAAERTRPTGLENVIARTVLHGEQRQTEIAVTDPGFFADAYPLLCAVADRAQLHGKTLPEALRETLRRFGHLLRAEDALSREQEIGLLGELCLLEALCLQQSLDWALACWRGPASEEHDFGFSEYDVEVKTTTAEGRRHWISSLTQLVPTLDRPLWLVSVQVTEAGAGGTSLSNLIDRIRSRAETAHLREQLDHRLRDAGWRERFATQELASWRLRAATRTYAVADDFPRLTPRLLSLAGIDHTRIPAVRYQIDLSGLEGTTGPELLIELLATITLESP
jgi:hypothetical protein